MTRYLNEKFYKRLLGRDVLLLVERRHYSFRRLIEILHFDEVIQHNLCQDLLKQLLIDDFVVYLQLLDFFDVLTNISNHEKANFFSQILFYL